MKERGYSANVIVFKGEKGKKMSRMKKTKSQEIREDCLMDWIQLKGHKNPINKIIYQNLYDFIS